MSDLIPESRKQLPDCERCGGSGELRSPDPGDDEFEVVDVCPDCMGEGKMPAGPEVDHLPDEPPPAAALFCELPGAQPRDWTPTEVRLAEYLQTEGYPPRVAPKTSRVWITPELVSPHYSGVGSDELGIFLHPAAWNCERLPGAEEARLAYFFKLVYMERLRQLKRWGDQRHPDGVDPKRFHNRAENYRRMVEDKASRGTLTWMDILLEEIAETFACPPVVGPEDALVKDGEPDLESEMVQSAAVLAAWHSDVCRRVWEAEQGPSGQGDAESLDEGMRGM